MNDIRMDVIEVMGRCPAGLEAGQGAVFEGKSFLNPAGTPVCLDLLAQIQPMAWPIRGGRMHFCHSSCPGCFNGLEDENRVIIRLVDRARPELGELFTEYWKLRELRIEGSEEAELWKAAEMSGQPGQAGYGEAVEKMKEALRLLRTRPVRVSSSGNIV